MWVVGPVGIEPTSSVPETDVLSIERRAHVLKENEGDRIEKPGRMQVFLCG